METEFVLWLQKYELLFLPMQWLSDLGPSTAFAAGLTLLYWAWDYRVMSRVCLIDMLSMWLTHSLKFLFHAPRPYWILPEIKGLTHAGGFGMPSGHAFVATSVWTYLAREWRGKRLRGFCVFAILGVGFSRFYLGVHSAAQILVGIILGLAIAFLFPKLDSKIRAGFQSVPLITQLGFVFGLSLTIALTSICLHFWLRNRDFPLDDWISAALSKRPQDGLIHPMSLHSSFVGAGTLLGFWGGYLILVSKKWNQNARHLKARFCRIAIGGSGVGTFVFLTKRLLYKKANAVLSIENFLIDYSYGFVIGLSISFLMPAFFHRLRI